MRLHKNIKWLLAGSVANIFEWYDYTLFGNLAVLMGSKFFPVDQDSYVSLLKAFLVFALGYIARPAGGILFGIMGDKFGRKVALSTSVMCMAFPTAFIGLLPTYGSIGIAATVSIVIARVIQGLSMGGALTGSILFNVEHTSKRHHGFAGSLSMAGISAGILLSLSFLYIAQTALTVERFELWGWRLLFLVGILIFVAGMYIRKYVAETPVFGKVKSSGDIAQSPIKTVFRYHRFDILMSVFINSMGAINFYMSTIFVPSFLRLQNFNSNAVNILLLICCVLRIVVTLFAGWLSDIVGRRIMMIVNVAVTAVAMPFIMLSLHSGVLLLIIGAQIFLSILVAVYIGTEPALQLEFYPVNVRSTSLALIYSIGGIFGGTTPCVLTFLYHQTGSFTYCIRYIELCAALSLIGLYFYKDRTNMLKD